MKPKKDLVIFCCLIAIATLIGGSVLADTLNDDIAGTLKSCYRKQRRETPIESATDKELFDYCSCYSYTLWTRLSEKEKVELKDYDRTRQTPSWMPARAESIAKYCVTNIYQTK